MPPVRPVGKTGQTGLLDPEQPRPVKPVQCTGQTGPGRSGRLFFRVASDLLRGFARSFEAFYVGLAFQQLLQTLVRTLEGLGDFGI